MERLLIKRIEMYADVTEIAWERWGGEPDALMDSGLWLANGGIFVTGVLEYAKAHVLEGIDVQVSLEKRP